MRSNVMTRAVLAASLIATAAVAAPIGSAEGATQGTARDVVAALSNFPQFAGLPDSASLDAPAVLRGTVAQLTGELMPGAQVLLSAWPRNEDVRVLPIGGTFDLVPIARAVAGEDGRYELRAAVTDVLRELAGPDGIDIELDVFHADRHYVYLSQATPTAEGSWVRELTGLPEEIDQTLQPVDNVLDLTLNQAIAGLERGLDITRSAPSAYTYRKPTAPGCTPFEKVKREEIFQTVATSLTKPGVTAEVSFARGARTESSTGASLAGSAFTANGSRSRTLQRTSTFDDEEVRLRGLTNVEYQVGMVHETMRRSCARDFQGNEDVLYVTAPVGMTAASRIADSKYPAWRCTPKDPRTRPVADKSVEVAEERAATYQRGFELSPIQGATFGGSSLSGYSQSVKVVLKFKLPKKSTFRPKFLCGHSGPPHTPGQRVQGFFG